MNILNRTIASLTIAAMIVSPLPQLSAAHEPLLPSDGSVHPVGQYTRAPGEYGRSAVEQVNPPDDYVRAPGEYGRSPGDYADAPSEYIRTPGEYGRSPADYADPTTNAPLPSSGQYPQAPYGYHSRLPNGQYAQPQGEYVRSPTNYANPNAPVPPGQYPQPQNSQTPYGQYPQTPYEQYSQAPYGQYPPQQGNADAQKYMLAPGEHVPYLPHPSESFCPNGEYVNASGEYVNLSGEYSVMPAQYISTTGGCGYEECRAAPNLIALMVFSAVGLAVIIAVALAKSSGSSSHSHD